MFPELPIAACLVAITVVIHAAGLSAVLRRVSDTSLDGRYWRVTVWLIGTAWVLVFLHLLEIALWAVFYWWQHCMPDLESSLYFSGVTYTTVGYGDLLLPINWRLLGPLEALTGILMSGLSVSFFFVVVSKVFAMRRGV